MDIDLDLFDPFDRLIKISVRGKETEIPENNSLLRGFQYLLGDAIASGRFCWNNECGNCEITCRVPGAAAAKKLRGCQVVAEEGMEIVELSPDLDLLLGR
ncbi:MAG: hypothetical protein HY049_05475 [Acidobacteria bacterium]|nr:hypothetical protein [Acidobacteriota bacterium]